MSPLEPEEVSLCGQTLQVSVSFLELFSMKQIVDSSKPWELRQKAMRYVYVLLLRNVVLKLPIETSDPAEQTSPN